MCTMGDIFKEGNDTIAYVVTEAKDTYLYMCILFMTMYYAIFICVEDGICKNNT